MTDGFSCEAEIEAPRSKYEVVYEVLVSINLVTATQSKLPPCPCSCLSLSASASVGAGSQGSPQSRHGKAQPLLLGTPSRDHPRPPTPPAPPTKDNFTLYTGRLHANSEEEKHTHTHTHTQKSIACVNSI